MNRYFKSKKGISIWITTSVIILLIILLALTVNHAREKAIIEQFSRQQATIAAGAAAGIEDMVAGIERIIVILSKLPTVEQIECEETIRSIQTAYDDLDGKVEFIVRLDGNGDISCGYPPAFIDVAAFENFSGHPFFANIRESREFYVGEFSLSGAAGMLPEWGSVPMTAIAVPSVDRNGEFVGATLAALSLKTIVKRYVAPAAEKGVYDFWIVDGAGTIIFHSNPVLVGKNVENISTLREPVFEEIAGGTGLGYGGYVVSKGMGDIRRSIVAYAPMRIGSLQWSFVMVTPYKAVIAIVRKAFINIMLGAAGLIVVVIITGTTIARAGARRLRLHEELKRLQEREEWQGKLLREKKTVEGIIEGSPVPTFVIDKEHRVILWNRACAELTGSSARDMIGTDRHYIPFYREKRPLIADIIVDYDHEVLQKYYGAKKIVQSDIVEGAYEAKDYFENLNGKDRYLYFLAAPIYDEKGEVTAAIESIQDISYEEEMARNLREFADSIEREKKTVEGIVEGSPIPTFVIDKHHTIIFWNKACAELTGYDAAQMIGTGKHYLPFYREKRPVIADFIIDGNVAGLDQYYGSKKVRKSEVVRGAYEARDFFANLGGRDRHLYFLAAPIYDDKGNITAAVETLQDISREKEMSEHLREYADNLQKELKENIKLRKEIEELYNYLQSIIDSLPDKIFDLSGEGIINFVSRDIKRDGGISKEIKGMHFTEFVDPQHRDYVITKWNDAKNGIFKPYELEVTARDGTRRDLLISPRPVKGTDRYVLVQRDITELKDLEKKYYESQKLAAVGQLSAGIAHEVRNPLSSIKMSLQILEKRMNPQGNDMKRFRIAQREVEHLEKLVNDVLVFARPAEPRKELSDVRGIMEHALAMVEKALTDKRIKLHQRYDDGIPLMNVDPAMMEQALINLYHNAVDAMEENGKLLISAKMSGKNRNRLKIEIEDNGCGIDEADLPHLFNPFFTKKKYGTGLGLSQVSKIIDQHQGTTEILSKKGEGTRFIITLPIEGSGGASANNSDDAQGPS
ncbi:MAG: PAS domain S-box protein [Deltaproteobacteria bacterium]|nr:PAS domain S-box protein [Deltaproteobacteria bacterium]